VPVEEVVQQDLVRAARGELLAFERQELGGEYVVGQVERLSRADLAAAFVAEQDRGPDDRVEDDVVLALEIGVQRVVRLPPLPPALRVSLERCPLEAGRK